MNAKQIAVAVEFFLKHTKEKKCYITNDQGTPQAFFEREKGAAKLHSQSIGQKEMELVDRADLESEIKQGQADKVNAGKELAEKIAAERAGDKGGVATNALSAERKTAEDKAAIAAANKNAAEDNAAAAALDKQAAQDKSDAAALNKKADADKLAADKAAKDKK